MSDSDRLSDYLSIHDNDQNNDVIRIKTKFDSK